MEDYQAEFSKIEIVTDETSGLVELDLISRHGQDRATKVRTNFIGHLKKSDPKILMQILEILSKKLPAVKSDEIIVAGEGSAVPVAFALAQIRGVNYNYGMPKRFGNLDSIFSLKENHRGKSERYLYGVKPNDSVIIVEDEVTSGNGVITLHNALKNYGVKVLAIASIIENLNFHTRSKIKTETNLDLVSLVQIKLS